jgi:hypothetical protein
MATAIRRAAVTGCLVLAVMLPACGTRSETARPTPAVTTSSAVTTGGAGPTGATPGDRASTGVPGTPPSPAPAGGFLLTEGVEHDACGIGLLVKFIPPSGAAGSAAQAFLVGGPVADVHAVVPDPTADQPLPANVAPVRAGTTVTVLGKRFKVDAVDLAHAQVRLEALC